MSSLEARIRQLEEDLGADPPRISAYHDLPFAVFAYDPAEEYAARGEIERLATRLEHRGRQVRFISLARLVWQAIRETEGVPAIAQLERELGFGRAQETVGTLLSDPDFMPLADQVAAQARDLDPERSVLFLVRAAALAPALYRCARLLDELHGRTMVPAILFYPGTAEEGTALRFMNMEERGQAGAYNYRVKIY